MKFEIGEIAIIAKTASGWADLVGTETTILDIDEDDSENPYLVDIKTRHGGNGVWATDSNLRKKKPPQEYKDKELNKPVSWDDVKTFEGEPIWKPEREKVNES